MVDIMGHIGFGLLFALPAWFIWNRQVSAAFVLFAAVASLLPDLDLLLRRVFPNEVHHHGVTHTVVFVVIAGIVGGAVFTGLFGGTIDEWLDSKQFDRGSLAVFMSGGFIAGGLSHLVADMLSAPDISTPIEPFWPFFDKPWSVDLVWYNATWINLGLLLTMVAAHIALAYVTSPGSHRFRLTSSS